ncbi:MAG: hypothetical protein ABIK89_13205 [Planctomycetota bacterium]
MSTTTLPLGRTTSLRERVAAAASRVDAEAGVIRDVKILGYQSKNGRTYTREALQGAIKLYEGIAVNIDHDSNGAHGRSVGDRAGWLENVRLASDGLRGDLHLLMSDPRSAKVLEAAQRRPNLLGLSHDATGQVREDRATGKLIVDRIEAVRSVDLVADPATTAGLFEGVGDSHYDRELARQRTGRPLLEAEDPATTPTDPADFASAIRAASTEAAFTMLYGRIGMLFEEDEPRDLLGVVKAIRDLLDEVEAAVDDPSTTIATADTAESLSYEALRDSIRPGGRSPRSDAHEGPESYEALREQIRGR